MEKQVVVVKMAAGGQVEPPSGGIQPGQAGLDRGHQRLEGQSCISRHVYGNGGLNQKRSGYGQERLNI